MSDIQLKKLISYSNENESDEFLWRWKYKKLVNHYDEIKKLGLVVKTVYRTCIIKR